MNAITITKAQEPNPFEKSFSSVTTSKLNHPPPPSQNGIVDIWVNDTSSYSYDSNSINNDVYSVSDHQTPSNSTSDGGSDDNTFINHPIQHSIIYEFEQQRPKRHTTNNGLLQQQQQQYKPEFNNLDKINKLKSSIKKKTRTVKLPEDKEKRRDFLERNRIAALKCRQRKKQWLSNLQTHVEYLTNDNGSLLMEAEALRKEIMDLKQLLVTHKDCPQYIHATMQQYQHH